MSTILSFKDIENKHDVCRGKDWIKKFCESLIDYGMKIKKLQEPCENAKFCDISRDKYEDN